MLKIKFPSKALIAPILVFVIMVLMPKSMVSAADGRFYLNPSTVSASVGDQIEMDVMLDSGNNDLISAVASVEFDPNLLEITNVQYGDLFCQYPESLYEVSNSQGFISLGGFCQDNYYNSNGIAGLFGRFIFSIKAQGSADISFVYNGTDDPGTTYILEPGSPSSLVDIETPTGAGITTYSASVVTTTGKDGTTNSLPETADGRLNLFGIILGVSFVLIGLIVFSLDINLASSVGYFFSRKGRVVVDKG